jgi:lysophospholipase L1-like esterase
VTLVALGDSVTRGHTEPLLGVHAQSWAQWLAEALDLPLHNLARDGARAADVVAEQLPRVRPGAQLAVLWVGINDTRSLDWDPAAYEGDVRTVLAGLDARRRVVVTVPVDLGRPRAAPKPGEANAILRRLAGETGAEVLDVAALRGFPLLLPDAVHLSALGQLAVGARAARALGAPAPSGLGDVRRGRADALRLGTRWGRMWARDVARRARERRTAASA